MADTSTTNDTDNPGDLRAQLQAEKDKAKALAAENSGLKLDSQLRDVDGLQALTPRQRRAILRDMADDGVEFSAETAVEIAKELGYKIGSESPPPTGQQDNGQQNANDNTQQQNQNGEHDDVEDSLTAMDLMNRARAIASGNAPNSDFETEIGKTENAAQLTELLRTKGARHGIVHEWDVP